MTFTSEALASKRTDRIGPDPLKEPFFLLGKSNPPPRLSDLSEREGSAVSGLLRRMNWIGRKIHLYNVTIGLYMLDWWERYLFNILMLCLLWYVLRYLLGFFESNLKTILQGGNYPVQISKSP